MAAPQPPCVALRADERVAGRAFSDPAHTARDVAALARLREALRGAAAGRRSRLLRFTDDVGRHVVAVPDWQALERAQGAALIGFFGQTREHVDHSAILALEWDIVRRAAAFAGLLAYHNAEFDDGQWGNMVVFAARADIAGVTGDPTHTRAVASTPRHYATLRLHRGALPDGCLGTTAATIRETLYLDFGESPTWRGLRAYEN